MSEPTQNGTLLDLLEGEGEHFALVAPCRPALTYTQLRQNVLALAAQLNRFGLGQGDRISIAIPNSPEAVIAFLAAATCGTAAPINPKYKPEEFAFYFEDTGSSALMVGPEPVEAALAAASPEMQVIRAMPQADGTLAFELVRGSADPKPEAAVRADDVALILHTSGTTSRPKRVPLRHRNLVASARNIVGTYALRDTDVSLCVMPLFHIHGIVASTLATLSSGGTVVCPVGGFNALEFWSWLQDFQPTWFSAVPTMYQLLLARAERHADAMTSGLAKPIAAARLRFLRSSSSSLPPIVLERLESTFQAPVLEAYSMTEASHQMTSNPLPPHLHKAGTVGFGHGVQMAVMDAEGNLLPAGETGEVVVQGPNVFDGYENNPTANATAFTDGWFRTGDQGVLDEDGYLALTGRLKELINRGGEKISPFEVDNVILSHPAVAQAIAFAVPHKTLGEDIHAAVVLNSDFNGEVTELELKAHCADTLADFKVPRQFHVLSELPRGATGKIQRLKMAELLNLTGDQQ
jgi:acyl-CoA synthetase (AMP-forming)/AMP-acid ligase II